MNVEFRPVTSDWNNKHRYLEARNVSSSSSENVRIIDQIANSQWFKVGSIVLSILGGFQSFGLVEPFINMKRVFRDLIDSWNNVVGPIARLLFGWIRELVPWDLPVWIDQYIMLGFVLGAATLRGVMFAGHEAKTIHSELQQFILAYERKDNRKRSSLNEVVVDVAPKFGRDTIAILNDWQSKIKPKGPVSIRDLQHQLRRRAWTRFITFFPVAYFALIPIWPLYLILVLVICLQRPEINGAKILEQILYVVGTFVLLMTANYAFFFLE